MAAGQTSSTYSFSSAPKAVTRKKYREPGDVEPGLYRSVKETCISWDKRVHRGNTYSMYTQNAIKEAIENAQKQQSEKKVPRKRKVKEPSIFDMPLPEHERVAVDLTKHLVANEKPPETEVESQTDEFLPEPPQEQYQPQRTGIDAHTQVEEFELFDFDREVEPILDVLVMKTLEQSIMEVEEEHELASMSEFKSAWYDRQRSMCAAWREQVEEAKWSESLQRQRAKSAELQKLRLEELQIRRGKIRILIDDGSGNPVPVGPIQLSSADTIDELQGRVYSWLQQNEPKIAAGWPHGVVLKLSGEAVQKTSQLFEAKPGQISMGPQEPPPPPEQEEEVEDPEAS